MNPKNVYFGWGKGRKIVSVKVRTENGNLVDEKMEVPRTNNKDHNGIVCVNYEVLGDESAEKSLRFAISFCAPGEPFSRPQANDYFFERLGDREDTIPLYGCEGVIPTAEYIREFLMSNVIKDALDTGKKEIAGISIPGWLRRAVKQMDFGHPHFA